MNEQDEIQEDTTSMEEKLEVLSSDTLEHTVNVDEIETTDNITSLTQQGNFLIGITDKGVRFRQHIPQGKILNKIDGKWILQNMNI